MNLNTVILTPTLSHRNLISSPTSSIRAVSEMIVSTARVWYLVTDSMVRSSSAASIGGLHLAAKSLKIPLIMSGAMPRLWRYPTSFVAVWFLSPSGAPFCKACAIHRGMDGRSSLCATSAVTAPRLSINSLGGSKDAMSLSRTTW